jgi:PAS domain S-box-containing protein
MDSISNWLGREGYLPHGYCFAWEPTLMWTMVASDLAIAASYFSIPLAILYFIRRRRDASLRGVAVLFSIFIFSCGATHLVDVGTLWFPVYDIEAGAKAVTAAASMLTATLLWMLMPRALRIPSVSQLKEVIAANEREISDRRRAEEELVDAHTNLAVTLASLEAGVITVDRDGRIKLLNSVAEKVTGWSRAEAQGRHLWEVWHQEGVAAADQRKNPVERASEVSASMGPTIRLTVLSRDGRRTPLEVNYSSTASADGAVRGVAVLFRDMTRLDRAEEESRQLESIAAENRQIVEASRLKSAFLANMSHELRTPLNSIIGFSELLKMGVEQPGSGRYEEFVGYILSSGHHLLQVINDVLDLSKVEAGKLDFYPEMLNVPEVVDHVVDLLRSSADKEAISIDVAVDSKLTTVRLDEGRLRQVLFNYLSNAIKFTPQGGVITVHAVVHDATFWRLEVEDTGPGIAPQDIARLFVDFQQLVSDFSKPHAGTGLGLALTKRLVEAQGGSVGVDSSPGVGSRFYALLPLDATSTTAESASLALEPTRALVVRYGHLSQKWVSDLFERAGYVVEAVGNVGQARDRLRSTPFQALSLDLDDGSGAILDLLAEVRQSELNKDVRVLVLTASAAQAVGDGFVVADVLSKPVGLQTLGDAMIRVRPADASRMRVMVVDDDAAALDLARGLLHSLNIDCLCIADGAYALQAFENYAPHAIILDLLMPTMNGFELLDSLRKKPLGRAVPVFVWSSLSLSEQEYRRLATAARAVLSKSPRDLELLQELLLSLPVTPKSSRVG